MCIRDSMTDDEAILAMTDDNLRHRERILPTEKAQSLKMQVEAIKHQGSRPGEEDKDVYKRQPLPAPPPAPDTPASPPSENG